MWDVEFDPYGFLEHENWLENSEKTEDILQVHHIFAVGPILDVGWYENTYRVVVVLEGGWDKPIESFQSTIQSEIKNAVYNYLNKYQGGA